MLFSKRPCTSVAWAFLVFVGVLLLFGHSPSRAAKPGIVGLSERGGSAVEYLGVIDQAGPSFTARGYITHVQGVDSADLYTNPAAPGPETARFTFESAASLTSHGQSGNVTQIVAQGTLTIYFDRAEIAAFDARFHNVLTVIAPNQGITFGTVDATQTAAQRFLLNGRPLLFGHPSLVQRMTLSGGATRSQVEPPNSETHFAASAVTK